MRLIDGLVGHDIDNLYNDHGHRCNKNIKDVNFRNYILFVGDNLGLRLDLPLEQTFPYILSDKLSTDYYNLCIFNGGIDIIKQNLFVWLKKYPAPKAIVIAAEFANAIVVSDQNFSLIKPADLTDPIVNDLLDGANQCGFFTGRQLLFSNLIDNIVTCPIYQVMVENQIPTIASKNLVNIPCESTDQTLIASNVYTTISKRTKLARASV